MEDKTVKYRTWRFYAFLAICAAFQVTLGEQAGFSDVWLGMMK